MTSSQTAKGSLLSEPYEISSVFPTDIPLLNNFLWSKIETRVEMGNAKTALQYLHHPSNWRPIRVKLCMICLSHRWSFLQKSLGMRTKFRIIVLTFFATKLICITIYTKQTVARESKAFPLISMQNNDRLLNQAFLEFASKSISLHDLQCFLALECLCRLTKTFIKKTLIVFFFGVVMCFCQLWKTQVVVFTL